MPQGRNGEIRVLRIWFPSEYRYHPDANRRRTRPLTDLPFRVSVMRREFRSVHSASGEFYLPLGASAVRHTATFLFAPSVRIVERPCGGLQSPLGVPVVERPCGGLQSPLGVPVVERPCCGLQSPLGVPVVERPCCGLQSPRSVPVVERPCCGLQSPRSVPVVERPWCGLQSPRSVPALRDHGAVLVSPHCPGTKQCCGF